MTKDIKNSSIKRIIYTVTELTLKVKNLLEDNFPNVWISGEVSNFKEAASGHCYFSIKDNSAVISAVLFKGSLNSLGFTLADGMQITCYGRLSVYQQRGSYQIIISYAEKTGQGELYAAFERLKEKLNKEGLFKPEYKKDIPFIPKTVGVVTSPTGAAIRDILQVSLRRFSGIDIIVYPTLVQGDTAAVSISSAIETAQKDNFADVLIVGRGGGSLEDLWAFNEEIVARAIFNCSIPVVSAVGHEIDFTISDFVSDKRVPTPSAAAELVFPDKQILNDSLISYKQRLKHYMSNRFEKTRDKLNFFDKESFSKKLKNFIDTYKLRLDDSEDRITGSFKLYLSNKKQRITGLAARLKEQDPMIPFRKGYSIVRNSSNFKIIKNASELKNGDMINIQFNKGKSDAEIKKAD